MPTSQPPMGIGWWVLAAPNPWWPSHLKSQNSSWSTERFRWRQDQLLPRLFPIQTSYPASARMKPRLLLGMLSTQLPPSKLKPCTINTGDLDPKRRKIEYFTQESPFPYRNKMALCISVLFSAGCTLNVPFSNDFPGSAGALLFEGLLPHLALSYQETLDQGKGFAPGNELGLAGSCHPVPGAMKNYAELLHSQGSRQLDKSFSSPFQLPKLCLKAQVFTLASPCTLPHLYPRSQLPHPR